MVAEVVRRSKVNAALLFGILLLIWAGLLVLRSGQISRAHNWVPVRIPFPLVAGKSAFVHFVSDLDGPYLIQMDLQRNLPFEELLRLEPPDVACAVTANGKSVRFEPFSKKHYGKYGWSGTYWSTTWGTMIGQFTAASGQRYSIRAHVIRAKPQYQKLSPHLEIVAEPMIREMAQVQSAVLGLLAIVLLLTAILCLAKGLHKSAQDRDRAREREASPPAT